MKTLVVGIGNPILGDDGVGFHVARELASEIKDENVDVKYTSIDGLNLLELVVGYDKVIIVDAIMTQDGEAGEIYMLRPENIGRTMQYTTSPHNVNLATAIEIGQRYLTEQMPGEVVIFAVGIQGVTEFTEEMTKKVKQAVPEVAKLILEEIQPKKQ